MNITSVSINSNNVFSQTSDNNVIKLLDKQKTQLQEQIQKVNESKLDDMTKQDRIKQLQDQIQQIDTKIQQIQTERLNQNTNKNIIQQETNKQSDQTKDEYGSNLAGMPQLVQAGAAYSQAKIMHNMKDSLNGKGNILKIEIKLDGSRGGNPKTKIAELHEIESRGQLLDEKMGDALNVSQKQVKESSKRAGKKDNNENNKYKSEIDTKEFMSDPEIVEKSSQQQEAQGIDLNIKKVDIKI
jgi:hypothetical protein